MRLTKDELNHMMTVANFEKAQLNKNELDTVLKLLEEKNADEVEIETSGGNGIGVTVTARIDNVDHDVTDYGCW